MIVLKEYFMIIVGNYIMGDTQCNKEMDAMAYDEYPDNHKIKHALEVWEAVYARVEKRYTLVEVNEVIR